MLVCPECQFENPVAHKFCQRCGTSLSDKECPECGATVSFQKEACPECGAFVANDWLALIFPAFERSRPEATQAKVKPGGTTQIAADGETPESNEETAAEIIPDKIEPLDPENRYQLRSDRTISEQSDPISQLQVWDTQPLQKNYLEQLLEQQKSSIGDLEEMEEEYRGSNIQFWQQLGVARSAIPYLVLQESLYPAVPVLQDTWSFADRTVVLLEDRSEWESLPELWGQADTHFSQLLFWLNEMAKLWEELTIVQCCQSLLDEDNLRVDEDLTLCLQRLYGDRQEEPPKLAELSNIWKRLFSRSGRTMYGPIAELIVAVGEGEVESTEVLRSRLQDLARQQEAPSPTPESDAVPPASPKEEGVAENKEKMVYRGMADDMPTVVLPMQLLSLSDGGLTDIGRQRDHNEDHFGIETHVSKQENALGKTIRGRGIYIVCDGMGGHAAGEVASAMAVESLLHYFKAHWTDPDKLPDEATIAEGILATNEKIYDVNVENSRSGSGRMGTTLVMLLVQDNNIAIAHVGDSRIYAITRKRGIEQLTLDHEVGQREILRGVDREDAYARPDAYQLTQAIGPRDNEFVKPDVQYMELNEDTLLLLCSDGLSDGELLETHYEKYLTPLISSKANLDQGLIELIDFANEYNGHDNITGLVVRIKMRPNADRLF
ncbi:MULTISPECIES: serine/threonine phosphatase [Spirulina sp. CCY15215]|uniref:serine/threonine phosphatase n=1 Tax=Spirulina sp. CCY15215 TaxID=2767591 RepID=UPI00194EBDDC|nr:serine/threonine phosphatase [Spirulina major]